MHKEQIEYCKSIKARFPEHFFNKQVLDVGSMDINGNNRYLFKDGLYVGVDIAEGKNVDIIKPVHKISGSELFDTIISTEMIEHDKHYKESIEAMFNLLKTGGFILITAASSSRPEHGTTRTEPESSPFTNDYYKNITEEMILEVIIPLKPKFFEITISEDKQDIGLIVIK